MGVASTLLGPLALRCCRRCNRRASCMLVLRLGTAPGDGCRRVDVVVPLPGNAVGGDVDAARDNGFARVPPIRPKVLNSVSGVGSKPAFVNGWSSSVVSNARSLALRGGGGDKFGEGVREYARGAIVVTGIL